MVEMDYRTDKEKAKDQIIEQTLRDVKRIMNAKDLEDAKKFQVKIKQLLVMELGY